MTDKYIKDKYSKTRQLSGEILNKLNELLDEIEKYPELKEFVKQEIGFSAE